MGKQTSASLRRDLAVGLAVPAVLIIEIVLSNVALAAGSLLRRPVEPVS